MAEGFRELVSAWHDYRIELDEVNELDSERVLVLHRRIGRGKTSGLDLAHLHATGAMLFHVRDGRVIRLVVYSERERAQTDLALDPESDW
jgi:ketosteroid isomerase-like protein